MTATTLRRDSYQMAMLTRTFHPSALKNNLERFNLLWIFKRPIDLRGGTMLPHRARQRQHEARRTQFADNLAYENTNKYHSHHWEDRKGKQGRFHTPDLFSADESQHE